MRHALLLPSFVSEAFERAVSGDQLRDAAVAEGSRAGARGLDFFPEPGIHSGSPNSRLQPSPRPAAGIGDRPVNALSLLGQMHDQWGVDLKLLHGPPVCPRLDRQDSAHAPLARHQLRPQRHGQHDVPARAPLAERPRRRCALIILANYKERTETESIPGCWATLSYPCPRTLRAGGRILTGETRPLRRRARRTGLVRGRTTPTRSLSECRPALQPL